MREPVNPAEDQRTRLWLGLGAPTVDVGDVALWLNSRAPVRLAHARLDLLGPLAELPGVSFTTREPDQSGTRAVQVALELDGDGEVLAGVADVLCAFVERHRHEGVTISLGHGDPWWEVVARSLLSPGEIRKRLTALSQPPENHVVPANSDKGDDG